MKKKFSQKIEIVLFMLGLAHIVMAEISGGGEAQVAPPTRGLGFFTSCTRQIYVK